MAWIKCLYPHPFQITDGLLQPVIHIEQMESSQNPHNPGFPAHFDRIIHNITDTAVGTSCDDEQSMLRLTHQGRIILQGVLLPAVLYLSVHTRFSLPPCICISAVPRFPHPDCIPAFKPVFPGNLPQEHTVFRQEPRFHGRNIAKTRFSHIPSPGGTNVLAVTYLGFKASRMGNQPDVRAGMLDSHAVRAHMGKAARMVVMSMGQNDVRYIFHIHAHGPCILKEHIGISCVK